MPTLDLDSFDEPSCRRATFRAGSPIALSNGQTWQLYPVASTLRPRIADDGRVVNKLPWEPDLFALLFSLYMSTEHGGPEPDEAALRYFNSRVTEVAGYLLVKNYHLTDEEAVRLIDGAPGMVVVNHCSRATMLLARVSAEGSKLVLPPN